MLLKLFSILVVVGVGVCDEDRTCKEHLESVEVMPGAFVPTCTEDGHYNSTQCHGSTGFCWCVEKITGEEVNGTKVRFDTPNCPHGPCDTEVAGMDPMVIGAYIPQCTDDGNYKPIQCHGSTSYCWCVHHETNEEIKGTKIKHEQPECPPVMDSENSNSAVASLRGLPLITMLSLLFLCGI